MSRCRVGTRRFASRDVSNSECPVSPANPTRDCHQVEHQHCRVSLSYSVLIQSLTVV